MTRVKGWACQRHVAGCLRRAHAQSESLLLLLLLPLLLLCRRFFDFLCFLSLLLRFSLRSFFDFLEDLCFLSLLLLLCLRFFSFFSLRAFFLQQHRAGRGQQHGREVRQHGQPCRRPVRQRPARQTDQRATNTRSWASTQAWAAGARGVAARASKLKLTVLVAAPYPTNRRPVPQQAG